MNKQFNYFGSITCFWFFFWSQTHFTFSISWWKWKYINDWNNIDPEQEISGKWKTDSFTTTISTSKLKQSTCNCFLFELIDARFGLSIYHIKILEWLQQRQFQYIMHIKYRILNPKILRKINCTIIEIITSST